MLAALCGGQMLAVLRVSQCCLAEGNSLKKEVVPKQLSLSLNPERSQESRNEKVEGRFQPSWQATHLFFA